MKLAASTLHLLDRPLVDVRHKLIRLGTKNIEIADSGYHSLNPKIVEQLQELRASYDLEYSIHAPYADTNLSADDDLIREWVLKRIRYSIRFASDLEARCVVIHPGWTTATDRFMKGRAWELNIRSLHWLQRYSQEYGVPLLIENVPPPTPYLLITVEDFNLFFDEEQIDMRMVLDVAHANIQSEVFEFLKMHGDKIEHIHVSDNRGRKDQHLPIGEGEINWSMVVESIKATGFDNWLVIESYRDIDKCMNYLKALI
jgi:sugar phosphate isomerase/epimerase